MMLFSGMDHPVYLQLRRTYGPGWGIEGLSTEIDKLRKLVEWTRARWDHDGWNEPSSPDALTILSEARQGRSFRCVEYAIVLAAVLTATGTPTRVVHLMTKDVETRESGAGHQVCEAYLASMRKWVYADPQFGAVPFLRGVPLDAAELALALADKDPVEFRGLPPDVLDGEYAEWISEYLFFRTVEMDNSVGPQPRTLPALRFGPEGSPEPQVFQRSFPLKKATFTHSEADLYGDDIVWRP